MIGSIYSACGPDYTSPVRVVSLTSDLSRVYNTISCCKSSCVSCCCWRCCCVVGGGRIIRKKLMHKNIHKALYSHYKLSTFSLCIALPLESAFGFIPATSLRYNSSSKHHLVTLSFAPSLPRRAVTACLMCGSTFYPHPSPPFSPSVLSPAVISRCE